MGESISLRLGVTLQIRLPQPARVRVIHRGEILKEWSRVETAVHTVSQPGAYRVEADLPYRGRWRTWILSNPIYISE